MKKPQFNLKITIQALFWAVRISRTKSLSTSFSWMAVWSVKTKASYILKGLFGKIKCLMPLHDSWFLLSDSHRGICYQTFNFLCDNSFFPDPLFRFDYFHFFILILLEIEKNIPSPLKELNSTDGISSKLFRFNFAPPNKIHSSIFTIFLHVIVIRICSHQNLLHI